MSNQQNVVKRVQPREEAYQPWLNEPPIQFPLCLDSPIKNVYNNNSSSHIDNGGNEIEVGMDGFLRYASAMDTIDKLIR